ncbi:MAG: hypothetical protein HC815_19580 [Richelia sp. RM1_1_1]|nr:hypothetical protein [Richelia sp. RM1_1_1]
MYLDVISRLEAVFEEAGCSVAIGWAHSMFSKSPLQDADKCMYEFKKLIKGTKAIAR